MEANCAPPPTAGNWTIEPTSANAITSVASAMLMVPNRPPKLRDTKKYTSSTRPQWMAEYAHQKSNSPRHPHEEQRPCCSRRLHNKRIGLEQEQGDRRDHCHARDVEDSFQRVNSKHIRERQFFFSREQNGAHQLPQPAEQKHCGKARQGYFVNLPKM